MIQKPNIMIFVFNKDLQTKTIFIQGKRYPCYCNHLQRVGYKCLFISYSMPLQGTQAGNVIHGHNFYNNRKTKNLSTF